MLMVGVERVLVSMGDFTCSGGGRGRAVVK